MAKSKNNKNQGAKPSVKVGDMKPQKDPKGGAVDAFIKLGDIKGESLDHKLRLGGAAIKGELVNPALTNYKFKK